MFYARLVLPLVSLILIGIPAVQAQDQSPVTSIVEAWIASPHGDKSSEAFVHWNEEGAVPEACATCHSGLGLMDFLGSDGSMAKQGRCTCGN